MTEQSFAGHRAVSIRDLKQHIGEDVLVQGWLYNMRSKGKLHFLLVRDGTGIVQSVMFKGNVSEEVFERAKEMTQEIESLRKALRRSERINEILKKTVGYFAKDEQ